MLRIAISGKMASGKTTLADRLIEHYTDIDIKKMSFATKVYDIARDLFGMQQKNRSLLQQIGGKMREIDTDIWTKYLERAIETEQHIVIDDLRFPNELKMLKRHGFFLIKLVIDTNEQIERIRTCYPENYSGHLSGIYDISELSLEDYTKFDIIIHSSYDLNTIIDAIDHKILKK